MFESVVVFQGFAGNEEFAGGRAPGSYADQHRVSDIWRDMNDILIFIIFHNLWIIVIHLYSCCQNAVSCEV